MNELDVLENIHGHNTLIVSFSGYALLLGGIQLYEFLTFLNKNFPDTDKLFLKDSYSSSYHQGVKGISTDIPSTVEYLRTKIQGYSKVLFLGNSGGGYISILLGSLLNVTAVLAFVPQTILRKNNKDPRYKDLKPLINNITKYYVYGNTSVKLRFDPHHISHCDNIGDFDNVFITRLEKVDLKQLRNSGELFQIIYKIIN